MSVLPIARELRLERLASLVELSLPREHPTEAHGGRRQLRPSGDRRGGRERGVKRYRALQEVLGRPALNGFAQREDRE